jgi:hypothetical protein
MKTVLNIAGTEIIIESTGNGASGMFFDMCEQAHRDNNKGMWRLHFLPWSSMPEYKQDAPANWQPPKEFADYAKMHGLTAGQLYWYWRENYDLAVMNGGQPDTIHRLTRQEFPATYSECFMTDSTLDFFPASLVQQAMLSKAAATILGCATAKARQSASGFGVRLNQRIRMFRQIGWSLLTGVLVWTSLLLIVAALAKVWWTLAA